MFACFLSAIMISLFSQNCRRMTHTQNLNSWHMFACLIKIVCMKHFPITIRPYTFHIAKLVPYIHRNTTCTRARTHTYTQQPLTSIADLKIPPESQQASSSHIRAADIMPAASATTLCNSYTAYIKMYSINNPVHTADLLKSNSCFHQSVISMLSRKACIKH